jgi:hypothetical protein
MNGMTADALFVMANSYFMGSRRKQLTSLVELRSIESYLQREVTW